MSNHDIAIEVKNLSKDFVLPHKDRKTLKSFFVNPFTRVKNEKQHALNNVSFEIKKGDFFGIVGRNGSGKSTLLKSIAGVYHPTKGHIKVNGSLVPFIELGVGFNPDLSGSENVYLNGSLLGFSRQEIDGMYDEIVEFAELEKFMDQKLKNYSSGMQVRLAFSIAIRAKGDILLLDEVLAVGDAAFQQKCFTYFEQLKKERKTIIFVSHDMSAVKRFCSKALLLENGNLKIKGNVNDVATQYLFDNSKNNIENERKEELKRKNNVISKIDLEIRDKKKYLESDSNLEFQINYTLLKEQRIFIGFSISKNGQSIAEMNTKGHDLPHSAGSHTLICRISKLSILQGVHEIGVAVFNSETSDILGYKNKAEIINIDSNDERFGGLIKLSAQWEVKK